MDIDVRRFKVRVRGRSLLMHNGQLANPLNEWSKALKVETSKRKKSDEDHERIAQIEFQGGLYFDDKLGPVLPGALIDATLVNGAKKKRLGSIFESCVRTSEDVYRLDYEGPRTREGLWADPQFRDQRGAGVQTSRVLRTRPKFTDWSVTFEVDVFPCELNPDNVRQAIVDAGIYVGFGDFRPRFGLFVLESFEEVKNNKGKKAA